MQTGKYRTSIVLGLSSSSSTSPSQESSTSSSPASERCDGLAPGNWPWNPQGTRRIRMTVCEVFQNDWRTLLKIPRIQKCLHPHACLMTQIRNAVRKWQQGSTVFYLRFPKHGNCDICFRTKVTKTLRRRFTGEAVRRAEKECLFDHS